MPQGATRPRSECAGAWPLARRAACDRLPAVHRPVLLALFNIVPKFGVDRALAGGLALSLAAHGALVGLLTKPRYPEAALAAGIEGTALVRAYVGADGWVGAAEVSRSSGNPVLDRTALEAIRAARFDPARRGGDPVATWVEVPVPFRLKR